MADELPYRELPITCVRCGTAILPEQQRNDMCRKCDAIRSIRIATTLTERFGEVMRGKGLEGRYAAELAVGEAQQMYPEIWSHFDNAREALAADDIATDAYDAVRADEQGLALLDVQLTGGKVYYLNATGHARAIEAGRALQATLTDVDWEALERADAKQIAAAGALTIPKWKQWLVGTAIVVGTILMFKIFG